MGEQMVLGKDLNVLMHNVAYGVYETLNVSCVLLCQLCHNGQSMNVRAGIGVAHQHWRSTGPITISSTSLPGKAVTSNQPIHMSGRANDHWLDGMDYLDGMELEYGVATSLKDSAGKFGLVMAFHRASSDFSAEDIDYIQSLSNLLSVAADRMKPLHRKSNRPALGVAADYFWNFSKSA
jgi:GAF domain-containing protein